MVLAQPLEVLLQILPPCVNLTQGQLVQPLRFVQIFPDTAERADRQSGSPGGQILQCNGHPLHFDGSLGQHILKLAVLKFEDRARLAGILDGG